MLDKILRAAILLSAGLTVVCRYVAFKGAESLAAETIKLLNTLGYAGMLLLLVSGIAFAILVKKTEKKQKSLNEDAPDDAKYE